MKNDRDAIDIIMNKKSIFLYDRDGKTKKVRP
jgi:hypothetical protein